MKKKLLILVIFCVGFISSLFSQNVSPGYIDGHLFFKFKDSYEIDFKVNENTSINYDELPELHYLFDEYGVTLITRPLLIFDNPKLARIIRLEFSNVQNIDFFIKDLELNPNIEYAEKVPYEERFVIYNDPYYTTIYDWREYNFKWHLEKINAPLAWEIQTGLPSVKVAIVDNAVWGAHPDLNISSSNQCNVSDGTTIPGNSSPPSSVSQNRYCTSLYEDDCPSYEWSHGTHCAGLVGAINDNGIGISSIGGGVTLMGVRAANDDDQMYYASNGVAWAINNGAKVVSMSYGSSTYSSSVNTMFETGVENGVIFIAAAGNDGDGLNEISYPAGYSSVIGVASINNDGKLSDFSQWGTGRADIAAPGGFDIYYGSQNYPNILSTTYCTNQLYNMMDIYEFDGTHYDGMQGTSMACPMVAGLVGLLASAYPDITFAQTKACLQSTATPLSSGSNPIGGQGYVNARAAVEYAQSLGGGHLTVSTSTLSYTPGGGNQTITVTSNVNWTVSESCDWITVSPATGSNNGSFTVTAIAYEGSTRSCTITVSGAGVSPRTITVTQTGSAGDNCSWLTNITNTDENNLNNNNGAVLWGQDRTNDIYIFAERLENTIVGTLDSIEVFIYQVSSYSPASSSVTFRIYGETGGLPGNVLGTKTVSYSSLTENSVNSIKFNTPVSITGNFYVGFELNRNPATDVLSVVSTGNLNRTSADNTQYVRYSDQWHLANDLYSADNFSSFYIWAKVCPQTVTPSLAISPSTLSYTTSGGNQTVTVTSNVSWTVSESCDWITVSPTTGSNNGSFTVTATANTGSSRNCTITVSGPGVTSRTITVTQAAVTPSLTVSPSTLPYATAGGSQTVTVTSNINWTVTESCDWITVSPATGSNNGSFTVTATANTGSSRNCTITVSGPGVTSKTITVTQAAAAPSLTIDQSILSYPIFGGNQTITVTSNINWTVTESCDWITVSPATGTNNGSFTVTAQPNTGEFRSCTITVSGTGVTSKTVSVSQAAYETPYLTVIPSTLSYTKEGGNQPVIISSNVVWNVSENCDWITVLPENGSNDGSFIVTAKENTGSSRDYIITVSGNGVTSRTITVAQDGKVGIETENFENSLLIYPNPTSDYINIKSTFEISKVQIIDMLGKVVLEMNNINKDLINISVNDLPNTMYIVRVFSIDGNMQYRKITKE